MEIILDTNALSAFFESSELDEVLGDVARLSLPVIVLGEYRFGLLDSRKREARERNLKELEGVSNVLPIDSDTVGPYAKLRHQLRRAGTPLPANDVWIGALAIQHDLPILSRDRHFDVMGGVRRIGW